MNRTDTEQLAYTAMIQYCLVILCYHTTVAATSLRCYSNITSGTDTTAVETATADSNRPLCNYYLTDVCVAPIIS